MNSRINELLEKYNAVLEISNEIEKDGYCVEASDINIVIVRSDLSANHIEQVILHELGHVENDGNVIGKYEDCVPRSKMEYKANYYMIERLLDTWCDVNNVELSDINYVAFLEANELSLNFMPIIEKVLSTRNNQIRYH